MTKIVTFLKTHKILVFVLVLIPVIIIVGQKLLNSDSSSSVNGNSITAQVKKGNIVSGISSSGQIATSNYLAITTSVNGIVKQVFVKEGDSVVQGQKIMEVTLDAEGEKSRISSYASYLRAKNSLTDAKNGLIPLETAKLQKQEAFDIEAENNSYQSHEERLAYTIAENDLKIAENSYNSQKANITQLEIALSSSWSDYQAQAPIITAPSSGVISNIVAVEGTKVENSVADRSVKTVASIKKVGTPIASLNIGEIDINKIKVGQKVNLTLSSISNKTFTGKVAGIDKLGTITSGVSNYPVIIKFDNSSDEVLPNMSTQAEIVVDEKENVLLVPTAAIKNSQGKKVVTVVKGEQTSDVVVETGLSDGSSTEIVSGLNEGEEVVIPSLPTSGFTTTSTSNQFRGGATFVTGGFGR